MGFYQNPRHNIVHFCRHHRRHIDIVFGRKNQWLNCRKIHPLKNKKMNPTKVPVKIDLDNAINIRFYTIYKKFRKTIPPFKNVAKQTQIK